MPQALNGNAAEKTKNWLAKRKQHYAADDFLKLLDNRILILNYFFYYRCNKHTIMIYIIIILRLLAVHNQYTDAKMACSEKEQTADS